VSNSIPNHPNSSKCGLKILSALRKIKTKGPLAEFLFNKIPPTDRQKKLHTIYLPDSLAIIELKEISVCSG
jgi:hypothetical protein